MFFTISNLCMKILSVMLMIFLSNIYFPNVCACFSLFLNFVSGRVIKYINDSPSTWITNTLACYRGKCPYYLTVQRYLPVCHLCTCVISFQPVNLLYKPLSDFQEELLPQDVPLRTIYNIYDEHERDRQSMCNYIKFEKTMKAVKELCLLIT